MIICLKWQPLWSHTTLIHAANLSSRKMRTELPSWMINNQYLERDIIMVERYIYMFVLSHLEKETGWEDYIYLCYHIFGKLFLSTCFESIDTEKRLTFVQFFLLIHADNMVFNEIFVTIMCDDNFCTPYRYLNKFALLIVCCGAIFFFQVDINVWSTLWLENKHF